MMKTRPNTTMFVKLSDDASYLVPPSSSVQNRLIDDLSEGSARFSVYMFADVATHYSSELSERRIGMAYARVMRPVFDGPVIAERWDPGNFEWIPA